MESGRGSKALAAARAAAKARREAAQELADQARRETFAPEPVPEPLPVVDLPSPVGTGTDADRADRPQDEPRTRRPGRSAPRPRTSTRRGATRGGRAAARPSPEPDPLLDPGRPFDPDQVRARRAPDLADGHGVAPPQPSLEPSVGSSAGSPVGSSAESGAEDRVVDERPPPAVPDPHFGRGVPPPTGTPPRTPTRPARAPRAPRTGVPAWYPPLVGAWAAAFVVVATLDADGPRLAGAAVLVLLLMGFLGALRAPARTPPTLATASGYAVVVVVCAVAAWFVARELHPAAGAGLATVLMTGLVSAYERQA